ncbi:MAG TPA: hypothetical protein VKZ51_10075 [Cyclobacteriaceae bacterium]|nr:hypothetical protein [Cyclobacteriaceae bacterium]
MKRIFSLAISFTLFMGCKEGLEPKSVESEVINKPRVFLFVHGAWGGGWEYAKVDSILSAKGDIVFRPTLTGLGERVHLANTGVSLTTHIDHYPMRNQPEELVKKLEAILK